MPAGEIPLAGAVLDLVGRSGIRDALRRGELLLYYQPIVDLRSRRPVAAEALLRWRQPVGLLAPGAFWSETDATCAEEIGRFVLDAACRQLASWRAAGLCPEVSVNTDPRELSRSWVVGVYDTLARYGLPPEALNIELTETARVDRRLGAEVSAALIRHGVGVSLDDAGTGFNALSVVSDLPLTELKIDRDFVSRLGAPRADALVRAFVALAAELGMRTVAEGVETERQAQILEQYGVDRAQGYLFSRPVAPDTLADVWRADISRSTTPRGLIHELTSEGASPATVAALLNRRAVPGPNGRRWRAESVLRELRAAGPGSRR